jgi:2-oxoglutarate/2-oxoacid ferredoxin oxidoreductase subunit alpha
VTKQVQQLEHVIIRFAGDSGDGMQLAGDRFTQEAATFGNDLSTLPNFPAEIRAPAGTLPGVSSFQLHFADHDILTPGDAPDVLVAMNPAALRANIEDLPRGADIIANTDEFTKRNLVKVGYDSNPLDDGSLAGYQLHAIPITSITVKALEGFAVSKKDAERAKNMFSLGMLCWLYNRPADGTLRFLEAKFAAKPEIMRANIAAFQAGWNYGETTEEFSVQYEIKPASLPAGLYRNITGNSALSLGLVVAGQLTGLSLFLGSYPITPASDILHELSKHKQFGVRTFQAEDEIGGVGAALGASFGGALGITTTSGPGMCLKAETIGLAVAVELPLIVCDVQRAGPSTGMPTKTEQADLLMALYGRNGESPLVVLAPATPGDCFTTAIEAVRIAVKYRTPVIILSDGYLANGSEPWRVPRAAELPDLRTEFSFATPDETVGASAPQPFLPFQRDPQTLARPWAIPGTPGLEHRIGGIEKADGAGTISYDADNHDKMVRLRQAKIDGIAADIEPLEVDDPDGSARVLVLGWGSTFGSIGAAVRRVRLAGGSVAQAHLRHLSPFPANLADVLKRYDKVLVPEINLGQLALIIRGRYLVDVISYNRVRGLPFRAAELSGVIEEVIANV